MIGGMVEHDGHRALAVHLAKTGDNETIAIRAAGLSAETIGDTISELRSMGLGCRTRKPLLHAWASPSRTYTESDWATYWELFEVEYGLVGHPHVEVQHLKFGRGGRTAAHAHRVYLRIDIDGRAIRTSHSAIRQEKVSRVAEYMAGERLTPGCFNKAVIDIATKAPTAAERAMCERHHDYAADEVWRRAADAWRRSDSSPAFVTALAEVGLRLAKGDKVPVLVSPGGATHPLLRAINKGRERAQGKPVRKAALDARLRNLVLPAVGDVRPLPEFNAGPFAVINLARAPLEDSPRHSDTTEEIDAAVSNGSDARRGLSMEQETALLELADAFHSAAANRAKAAREAIEAEVLRDIEERARTGELRQRIEAERASWDLPGIGVAGWRDAYRARLAALPEKYGAYLRWVEQLDAERSRITLKSGVTVTLAPTRAWTEKSAGHDAMAIMIAHAREHGWTRVTITGAGHWRHNMAKAVIRAGLEVAEPDLVETVEAEKTQMAREAVVETWWRERCAYLAAPAHDRRALRKACSSPCDAWLRIRRLVKPQWTTGGARCSSPTSKPTSVGGAQPRGIRGIPCRRDQPSSPRWAQPGRARPA